MDFVLFGHVRGMHQPVEPGRRPERCLPGLLLIEAGRPVSPDRPGRRPHGLAGGPDAHQARARLDGP